MALSEQDTIYGNPPISYQQKVKKRYIDVKDTAYFFLKDDGNNCTNAVVRRPVIFIDGFDPTNDRKVGDIYKNYINRKVIRQIGGVPTEVSLGDYMIDNGNTNPNDDLDFIILDFKHGNDLLERNAMTLVALIVRMNATFGANYLQDITLIGPSMGSLIAQYALTYMENKGIPHRVKTYISFDGNHQGANVPIGLQNYVEYITKRGILKNVKIIRNSMYNGYAARQQLAHHHTANSEFPAPDAMRTQFLVNLTALNPTQYPQNCRKVALINGTNKGTLNPYHGVNSNILSIDVKRNGWKSIWGLCNGDICKKIKWTARTATNNGSNVVAEMWTASPLYNTLFWLPLGKKNYYAQAAWGGSSQDNAPGGLIGEIFTENYETHATFLAKELIYLITGDKPDFDINLNNFTMMPSYSSADLQFPNKNLYMKWDDQYLCGKTPFDFVYAPPTNEEHVFVSPQGSVYFENEARCAVINLPTFTGTTINGGSSFCVSGAYSITSCKPGINVTWTASPSGIVSISGSGTQVTITKISNGKINLTANFNSGCTNQNINITKYIGIGLSDLNLRFPRAVRPNPPVYNDVNVATQYTVQTNPFPGATETWTVSTDDPSFNWTHNSTTGAIQFFFTQANRHATFSGISVNSCGSTSGAIYYYSVASGGGGGGTPLRVSTSPNPAQNQLTIAIDRNAMLLNGVTNEQWMRIKEIKLFDKLGNLKKSIHFPSSVQNTVIDISNLINDVYSVQVSNGTHTLIKQIIIQR